MASVLFLAPDDLGEAVLATGALAYVLRPNDELTLVAGAEARTLFRAAPARTHVRATGKAAYWALFGWRLGMERFDICIDARGGWLGRVAPIDRRVALRPARLTRHLVEDWTEALAAPRPLAPVLWVDDAARRVAASVASGEGGILVLAPGGMHGTKRWPAERFAAAARRLVSGPLGRSAIIVLGAAERDQSIVAAIVASLDADGILAQGMGGQTDLLAGAALMERATLCIGNDNALTHIAAAMGAPTLTLLGPTDERVRAPYGPRTLTLRARSFEAATVRDDADTNAMMDDIGIDAVETAALELLHAGGLR